MKSLYDKVYVILISAVFIFIAAWCPLLLLLSDAGFIKVFEWSDFREPEKTYEESQLFSSVLNGIEQGKADIQHIYSNYLPFYGSMIQSMRTFEIDMKFKFVEALRKMETEPDSTLSENDLNDDYIMPTFRATLIGSDGFFKWYIIDQSNPTDRFMDCSLNFSPKQLYSMMQSNLRNLNRIIAANDDVNVFVYMGTRAQDMPYFNEILPDEFCTYEYLLEFLDGVEGAAGVGYLDISTPEKRLERLFKTDHHWNPLGLYYGYCDIITMMREVIDIPEPHALKEVFCFPEARFRGSWCNRSGYTGFWEGVSVIDLDMPTQSNFRDEGMYRGLQRGALDGRDVGFYGFYGSSSYLEFPNNTGRNLLVIGDSYTDWGFWIVASNFDKAYRYNIFSTEDMNYNDFISKNNITDVLILQFSARMLFSDYDNGSALARIRTE